MNRELKNLKFESEIKEKKIESEKSEKCGIKELREKMENVSLDEISEKDIKWCATKWHLIMGMTLADRFASEVFDDPEYYYGKLMFELEKRIKDLGGKVMPMESVEISTEKKVEQFG